MGKIKTISHTYYESEEFGDLELPVTDPHFHWLEEPLFIRWEGDTVVMRYLVHDVDPEHPFDDWDSGVTLTLFDNGAQRDEFLEAEWPALAETGRSFWVERYEHGLVKYALTDWPNGRGGESSSFDRSWDVAHGVGVITVDDTVDLRGDALRDFVRTSLEQYTDYCNGDVYEVIDAYYEFRPMESDAGMGWDLVAYEVPGTLYGSDDDSLEWWKTH